jgi:hypothetical protein
VATCAFLLLSNATYARCASATFAFGVCNAKAKGDPCLGATGTRATAASALAQQKATGEDKVQAQAKGDKVACKATSKGCLPLCLPLCLCVALLPPLLPLRCIANSRQRYFAGGCAPGISCVAKSKAQVANSRQRYFAGGCAPDISCVALLPLCPSALARVPCCLMQLHMLLAAFSLVPVAPPHASLRLRSGHKLRC